jgi:DnaJ-class molecular chaperone
MPQKDYYEILGINRNANYSDVKTAYRRLAFQYHPDTNPGNDVAVEKMKEINEAYAVLSDRDKRRQYDRFRDEYGSSGHDHFRRSYSEKDIFRGSDINTIFEEMAQAFGFRTFDEVFSQTYGQGFRTFEFKRPGIFGKVIIFGRPHRQKQAVTGSVSVPSRLFSGVVVKLAGYVVRKMIGMGGVTQDVDRYDILHLDRKLAQEGGVVSYIDRVRSKELAINLPRGLRDGQIVRLKGMGNEGGLGVPPGDLYLKVEIRKRFFRKMRSLLSN